MNKIVYIINKMRDVKPRDIISIFSMGIARFVAPIAWKEYKGCWLVCEEAMEARDNGYWFYKYMREKHPDKRCIYAVSRKSVDYTKVTSIGETVEFGSIKHWGLYFLCEYNISSQKGGKPNAAVCAFMELNGIIKVKNVFLQHGVTINNARWLYSDRSNFTYFITATRPENDFIESTFGFPKNTVQYTGFPRFDNLHNIYTIRNRVLIMPSWRAWFKEKTAQVNRSDSDFEHSEYLEKWRDFISCNRMKEIIKKFDLEVIFYPHRNMQTYIDFFKGNDSGVIIASARDYDIQELMKSAEMMITDYSSVFFDMVYMMKPVIFYQFDEQKFRKQQYQEGYFDYHNNSFGKSFKDTDLLFEELVRIIEKQFQVSTQFKAERSKIFELFDAKNSERIYQLLTSNNK
ncbi:MAG: teichoic acid biosynthesis protein B [Lachnospiraceae bacterium]|jgi:CDP-glycerol glycerophosphotransferase|nr:teichoic acid biosynthesis protein B [Lachnospiraceae bacterium]